MTPKMRSRRAIATACAIIVICLIASAIIVERRDFKPEPKGLTKDDARYAMYKFWKSTSTAAIRLSDEEAELIFEILWQQVDWRNEVNYGNSWN